jgi:nucleoside-diphosphate-sugar epimerase
VDNSWRSLSKNIAMAHNVAQSIPDTGLRSLIFLSSADVYGKQIKHLPITEETIPNPDSYYAVSKLMSEQILTLELAGKCPVSILRLPGVYGPGDSFRSTIGRFVLSTLEEEPMYIFGTGEAHRDYVTVSDLTGVIDRLLEIPYEGVLNVATGTSVEFRELVALIGKYSGVGQDIRYNPQFDEGSGDLIFDTARLKSVCPGIEFAGMSEGIAGYLKILRQPV